MVHHDKLSLTEQEAVKLPAIRETWMQMSEETDEEYEWFLHYLAILPISDRNVTNALRDWLISKGVINAGEPIGQHNHLAGAFRLAYTHRNWLRRANAFDSAQNTLLLQTIESSRHEAMSEMIRRHLEGAHVMAKMALESMYRRDEDGNVCYNEKGVPELRILRDEPSIVRAFKTSIDIERTARGLPAEIYAMSTEDIRRRIVELKTMMKVEVDDPAIELEDGELMEYRTSGNDDEDS